MKGKPDTFPGYRQGNKFLFVCLEFKPPQASYGSCVKMVENGRKNIFRGKKKTEKVPLMFTMKKVPSNIFKGFEAKRYNSRE